MIRKLFEKDTALRIVSLFVAIILWMYVVSLNNPQVEIPVNGITIEVRNQENIKGNKLHIVSMSAEKTNVKIYGRMSEVSAIKPDDIKVYIDAADVYSANSYYLETKAEIESSSVTVSQIDTKEVNLYVDYILAVEKDIDVMIIGEPKTGYMLTETTPASNKVVIKGPQSIVNKVNSVKATLDVTNANKDFSTVCPVKMYTANGEEIVSNHLSMTVKDVSVSAKLLLAKEVNVVIPVPQDIDKSLYDITVTPSAVKITGKTEQIESITSVTTEQLSDTAFTNDENIIYIQLPIIEGVKYADDLSTVEVKISAKKIGGE